MSVETTTIRIGEPVVRKVRQLALEMAKDPAIQVRIEIAAQHRTYHRFRNAHRAFWEQSRRFETYYQEQIFALADKVTKAAHLTDFDSISNWDRWYSSVVHPLRSMLWDVWEAQRNLEGKYMETLLRAGELKASAMEAAAEERPAPEFVAHSPEPKPESLLTVVLRALCLMRPNPTR